MRGGYNSTGHAVSIPLYLAENVEVARMLVECGADMTAQDKRGTKVGICACESIQEFLVLTCKHRSRQRVNFGVFSKIVGRLVLSPSAVAAVKG
jgi:hypothetical protein